MNFLVYSEPPADSEDTIATLKHIFAGKAINVKGFDSNDLRNGILHQQDTVGFCLPGIKGEVSGYTDQIGETGLKSMSESVSQGRVLLTAFAGSYFICRETIYEPIFRQRRTRAPANAIFKAVARGPVNAVNVSGNDVLLPIQYKSRDGNWKTVNLNAHSGPVFQPDDQTSPDLEILAQYAELPGNPPAAICLNLGDGQVIALAAMPHRNWLDKLMSGLKSRSGSNDDFLAAIGGRLDSQILTYRSKFSI